MLGLSILKLKVIIIKNNNAISNIDAFTNSIP